ncbi:chloride channel protein [Weissella muntiaci]
MELTENLHEDMMQSDKKEHTGLVLSISTVILGVIVGFSSLLLSLFLEGVEKLFLGFEETTLVPVATGVWSGRRLISLVLGGLIAAGAWYLLKKYFKPTVGINKALNGNEMPFWATVVHVMTQIFFVGTGGSIGRELAPREAGAMLAQKWLDLLAWMKLDRLDQTDRRLLVAAAAGAGFAGVYIAPITGMMFSVEILMKKVDKRTVAVSLVMSVVATLVGSILKGFHPYYFVADTKFTLILLPFVLVVGPLGGLLGAYLRRAFQWAEQNKAQGSQILWQLPLVAGLTGLVAMIYPQIMGNGRGTAQLAIGTHSSNLVYLLIFGMLAKAIITSLTIKAGAWGGTLTPSIAVGAAFGAIATFAYILLVPGASVSQGAVIGACAVLAASQQAPLMALFMIFEVCHLDYSALLPLSLSVALSISTAKLVK